jgi:hypothetical protein
MANILGGDVERVWGRDRSLERMSIPHVEVGFCGLKPLLEVNGFSFEEITMDAEHNIVDKEVEVSSREVVGGVLANDLGSSGPKPARGAFLR